MYMISDVKYRRIKHDYGTIHPGRVLTSIEPKLTDKTLTLVHMTRNLFLRYILLTIKAVRRL